MSYPESPERFKLSFTAGGLFIQQATLAATLHQDTHDWQKVRESIDSDNLLQARTQSSAQRLSWELVERLKELTDHELKLLIDSTLDERAQLMWVAFCRRYQFVADFAEEVLRERYLIMAPDIKTEHFDSFMTGKTLWHPELAEIKESTFKKLRSTLFLAMREADLITENGLIIPTHISERVLVELSKSQPSDVRFFPTRDAQ